MMRLARVYNPLQLLPIRVHDGRLLYLDLRQPVAAPYLLTGQIPYEFDDSLLVKSLVFPGEVAIDIGANVGWYSTLLAEAVGTRGVVYAFEPGAEPLRMLRASARRYPQLRVESFALSDHDGEATLHIPLEIGNASLRGVPRELRTERCKLSTLDRFLEQTNQEHPVFIKCDVEGAELEVLRGASRLLSSSSPPIWMIEMNPFAAERFGHSVEEIVGVFFAAPGKYHPYRVDVADGRLTSFPKNLNSIFNAFFVPQWLEHRLLINKSA